MASRNQRKKRNKRGGGSPQGGPAHTQQHTQQHGGNHDHGSHDRDQAGRRVRRTSTETKSALRTTELVAYAATVLAIVIASLALDADSEGGRDPFGAEQALRYITYLTIGYMVARGLAKAHSWTTHPRRGSHEPHRSAAPVVDRDEHDGADHDRDHDHHGHGQHDAHHDHDHDGPDDGSGHGTDHGSGHQHGADHDHDHGRDQQHDGPDRVAVPASTGTTGTTGDHRQAASVDVEDVVGGRADGADVPAGVSSAAREARSDGTPSGTGHPTH